MEMLRTIAGIIDPDAVIDLENMQQDLKYLESEGFINTEERDALRHYLGIQTLGNKYGGSLTWLIGAFHEGIDLFMPGQSGKQAQVDMQNNNIALEDLKNGISIRVEDLTSKEAIRNLLDKLVIPPPAKPFDNNLFENYAPETDEIVEENPYDKPPPETTDIYGDSFLPNLDNE